MTGGQSNPTAASQHLCDLPPDAPLPTLRTSTRYFGLWLRSFQLYRNNMNLAAAFISSAERNLTKPALFWGDQVYSYELLLRQTRRVAAHLSHNLGVKRGDRVGLWLKNCPEFVPSLFGALLAGAAVVPINNFLKPNEVSYILADAGIDVVIADAATAEELPKLCAARPQLRSCQVEDFAPAAG